MKEILIHLCLPLSLINVIEKAINNERYSHTLHLHTLNYVYVLLSEIKNLDLVSKNKQIEYVN